MPSNPELWQEPDGPQPNLFAPDVLEEVPNGRTFVEEISWNDVIKGASVLGLDAAEGQGQGDRDRHDEAYGEGEREALDLNCASKLGEDVGQVTGADQDEEYPDCVKQNF